jgi:hypothetical protein
VDEVSEGYKMFGKASSADGALGKGGKGKSRKGVELEQEQGEKKKKVSQARRRNGESISQNGGGKGVQESACMHAWHCIALRSDKKGRADGRAREWPRSSQS